MFLAGHCRAHRSFFCGPRGSILPDKELELAGKVKGGQDIHAAEVLFVPLEIVPAGRAHMHFLKGVRFRVFDGCVHNHRHGKNSKTAGSKNAPDFQQGHSIISDMLQHVGCDDAVEGRGREAGAANVNLVIDILPEHVRRFVRPEHHAVMPADLPLGREMQRSHPAQFRRTRNLPHRQPLQTMPLRRVAFRAKSIPANAVRQCHIGEWSAIFANRTVEGLFPSQAGKPENESARPRGKKDLLGFASDSVQFHQLDFGYPFTTRKR